MAKERSGIHDIWQAKMATGAFFGPNDIPYCPTTAKEIPHKIILWTDAVSIHRKHTKSGFTDYYDPSFVCFYQDDWKFDGTRGIWSQPEKAFEILSHFGGLITPDFSTYQEFPDPIKRYNTYRMRLFGYHMGRRGLSVLNNVRWGTDETYSYCFEGLPHNDIVVIGTVGGSPRKIEDRIRFEKGLFKMVESIQPRTILVYGSANYPCFRTLEKQGVTVISYPSKTNAAFAGRGSRYE